MDSANDGDYNSIKEIYGDCVEISRKRELLEYRNKKDKSTALHLAAKNGHSMIVEYLVFAIRADFPDKLKSWINSRNIYDFTPLINVCFRGYLTKGMAKDKLEDRLSIVKCLVNAGANIMHFTQDTEMTCMHWAAYSRDADVVKWLLKEGSQPFKFSRVGRLAIDVAGSCKAWDVVDVFLDSYRRNVIQKPLKKRNKSFHKKSKSKHSKSDSKTDQALTINQTVESKTIVHDKIVEEHESNMGEAEFIDSRSKDELLDGKNADSHISSAPKISEEKKGSNTSDTSNN